MKNAAKLLSLILCVSILATGLCPTFIKARAAEAEEIEEIYISDIFYAYPSYIEQSTVLSSYSGTTYNLFRGLYNDYLDSPNYKWSLIKEGLKEATDIRSFVKTISDYSGATNFTYNAALDSANELMASKLLSLDTRIGGVETTLEWTKALGSAKGIFTDLAEYSAGKDLSDSELLAYAMKLLKDSRILKSVISIKLDSLLESLLPKLSAILSLPTIAEDIYKAIQTIVLAVILEDFRLEAAGDILSVASSGALYDGMTRLYNKLNSGFVSYFIKNYITDKLLDKLTDIAIDLSLGSVANIYNVASAIIKIGSLIVFDLLMGIADIDELTTQLVISQYCKELYSLIKLKAADFGEQFSFADIQILETLFRGLTAATDGAFDASEKIALDSNSSHLSGIKASYKDFDLYSKTLLNVKSIIANIPESKRIRTRFEAWSVTSEYRLIPCADRLESDAIYCPGGEFNGNLTVSISVTDDCRLTLPESTEIIINGKVRLSRSSAFTVDGTLHILGDLELDSYSAYYSSLIMKNENARLYLSGDFLSDTYSNCKLSGGTLIFCGNAQQEIENLKAYNITVLNPEGIKYLTTLRLLGHFDLSGNPLERGTIGNSETTHTEIYADTASFDSLSDFGYIRQIVTEYTLKGNLTADFSVPSNCTLMLPEGKGYELKGYLNLARDAKFRLDGSLKLAGNIILNSYSSYYSSLIMEKPDSKLYLTGKFDSDAYSNCKLSGGTLIFCGSSQQEIENLKAYNITVTNPMGIKYLTSLRLLGHFDLSGNPLERGNIGNTGPTYTEIHADTASFDETSDFEYIIQKVADYTIKGNITADLELPMQYTLNVPEGADYELRGNLSVARSANLRLDGSLKIIGNLNLNSYSSYHSSLIMEKQSSKLYLTGNFASSANSNCKITSGEVILCGGSEQKVKNIRCSTLIIQNESAAGVTFESAISPTRLFNHNGLKFTLYNNGSKSVFPDFDGDGMLDNSDPYPTLFDNAYYYGNYCDLNGDEKSDVKDLIILKKQLSGIYAATADFNSDGSTTADELAFLKKIILGLYNLVS